jgi:hypothetical protein
VLLQLLGNALLQTEQKIKCCENFRFFLKSDKKLNWRKFQIFLQSDEKLNWREFHLFAPWNILQGIRRALTHPTPREQRSTLGDNSHPKGRVRKRPNIGSPRYRIYKQLWLVL